MVKKISKKLVQWELAESFPFYPFYKEYLDVSHDGKIYNGYTYNFHEELIGKYYNLGCYSYSVDERKTIVRECLDSRCLFLHEKDETSNYLLIHEYTQRLPWILSDFVDDIFIKDNSVLSRGCYNGHGIIVMGNLKAVERQLFFLPFLMNYRDINILPFDFAIFKDDKLEFLIEVQGRQHYEIVRHSKEETFEILQQKLKTTQSHDNIKEGYCKCNNIKLIKIPYWDIKNNKYKEIINTLIHNI